jgi:hypothetical protein
MAVEPLYQVKSDLLLRIRLSEVASSETKAVIDQAIKEVRLGFYSSLTPARALEISGYADSDNPTTDNEITKGQASVAESLWVTAILMDLLPQMFIEGENDVRQQWNEEPLTRDAFALRRAKKELLNKVEIILGGLKEPENTDVGPVKSFSTGAQVPYLVNQHRIGRSTI